MTLGPANEPVAVITAIASLAVFLSFFGHILISVPKHWGVKYNDRLSRHLQSSIQGLLVEIFNAVFSLATCVLFVLDTYEYGSKYNYIVTSFCLEMTFDGFFLCYFLLHLYLAADKLWHLLSLQALVDIVTVGPSYMILFMNSGLRTSHGGFTIAYLALRVTRVIRLASLLVSISSFSRRPTLAFDQSRQVLVLRSQLVRWCLRSLVVIFIMAGFTNFLVEAQNSDWGSGCGQMPFHDALYFIVVTFSTVGYGDISPSTPVSRLLITGSILMLFFCAPLLTNTLVSVSRLTPKHGGRLSKSWGTGHIVVGCDSSCLRVVSVLLRELLAPESMAYHTAHVVIVVPQEPTLAWKAFLCLQPSFAVTYLNGDLSSARDLSRARVADARACFILSDRLAADTDSQDKTALVRALCAHQASPPEASVLCLVTHSQSKKRLERLGVPSASVVCYDDVMDALVSNACLHPGFSTVWATMLSCIPEADYLLKSVRPSIAFDTEDTEREYLKSLQRVMIRFELKCFEGQKAGDVALELYKECECTLFALICTACSGSPEGGQECVADIGYGLHICPRVHPDYCTLLRDDDVGVFIGATHKAADRLARHCAAKISSRQTEPDQTSLTSKSPSGLCAKLSHRLLLSSNQRRTADAAPEGAKGSGQREEERHKIVLSSHGQPLSQAKKGRARLYPSSRGYGSGPVRSNTFDITSESSVCSLVHENGDCPVPASSPLSENLYNTPPRVVLVIAQSLSFALGVVLSLCDAVIDVKEGSSALTVLCPPAWWDEATDEPAQQKLAARFPSVRVRKGVPEAHVLLEWGAEAADLVCVISSRVSERHGWGAHSFGQVGSGSRELGSDNDNSKGKGSDGWAMGVVVDVLGVVTALTRVVVRFDDPASAEQHQVISAHVRRRAALFEKDRKRQKAAQREAKGEEDNAEEKGEEDNAEEKGEEDNAEEKGEEDEAEEIPRVPGMYNRWFSLSLKQVVRTQEIAGIEELSSTMGKARIGESAGMLMDRGVYFDDTRGVVHEGFDNFYAIMSGYSSGDVVIGNAAELLLLQTMLVSNIQPLMTHVLEFASRIPIEHFWPKDTTSDGNSGTNDTGAWPKTYGEAFIYLLKDQGLLALGIHRPPPHRHPKKAADNPPGCTSSTTSSGKRTHYPGGSRYISITCPDGDFDLHEGDCFFVLRRPREPTAAVANPATTPGKTVAFDIPIRGVSSPRSSRETRDEVWTGDWLETATSESESPLSPTRSDEYAPSHAFGGNDVPAADQEEGAGANTDQGEVDGEVIPWVQEMPQKAEETDGFANGRVVRSDLSPVRSSPRPCE